MIYLYVYIALAVIIACIYVYMYNKYYMSDTVHSATIWEKLRVYGMLYGVAVLIAPVSLYYIIKEIQKRRK